MAAIIDRNWLDSLPYSVMVCDRRFRLLYMNEVAVEMTGKYGGRELLGTNILKCHPAKSQRRLRSILASGRPYVYTVTERGRTKLTYESVWKTNGRIAGLLEIQLLLPKRVHHRPRT